MLGGGGGGLMSPPDRMVPMLYTQSSLSIQASDRMDELSDRVIYIGNVAAEIDEPSLLAIFSNCGPVTEIRLAGQVITAL